MHFNADKDGEGSIVDPDDYVQQETKNAAELCFLDKAYMVSTLTTRQVETRGEVFTVKLKPQQATDARDALAKALYGKLFIWLVAKINDCIATDLKESRAVISVLDIFGFECFKNNSFEQLCINYTNETLQQQFNQFIFKMEQQEYEKEGITWSFISFPDNQDCLDLIEGKPAGILAMLDDECRLPQGSDIKYAGRVLKEFGSNGRFFITNKMKAENQFGIRHYAGEVAYNTQGFVEKNKDQLPKEAYNLFLSSSSILVRELFGEFADKQSSKRGPAPKSNAPSSTVVPPSVATQFKQQLSDLMKRIHTTRPHYIRCLKPNDDNVGDKFVRLRVNEQLRYGGVLEAVRVARSGYPVRLAHAEFFARYRCLGAAKAQALTLEEVTGKGLIKQTKKTALPINIAREGTEASLKWCEKLFEGIMLEEQGDGEEPVPENSRTLQRESVQLGKTKIFLRKLAYELLESKRMACLSRAATKIQAFMRGAALRREFIIVRSAAMLIQRTIRGMHARRRANTIRRHRASIKIQAAYRCHVAYARYHKYLWGVLRTQCRFRGLKARRVALALKQQVKSVVLQSFIRQSMAARKYRRFRRSVINLQCGFRMRMAKKQLRELKVEAKQVGNLQKDNDKLKEELKALKELLAKKAEADRQEKHRLLEEEKAAAAAATLAELETWKVRFNELQKKYEEEKGLRVQVEVRLQETVEEVKAKESLVQQTKSAASSLDEKARALEAELVAARRQAVNEAAKRKVVEAKLANLPERVLMSPPPPPPPSVHHHEHSSELARMQGLSIPLETRLLAKPIQTEVISPGPHGAGHSRRSTMGSVEEFSSRSSQGSIGSHSRHSSSRSLPEVPAAVAPAAPPVEDDNNEMSSEPSPSPTVPEITIGPRRMTFDFEEKAQSGVFSDDDDHDGGEDVDENLDLEDTEQQPSKSHKLMMKKENLEKFIERLSTFKDDLVKGVALEVLEIGNSKQSNQFFKATMKLTDLQGDDDEMQLWHAHLTFEMEKAHKPGGFFAVFRSNSGHHVQTPKIDPLSVMEIFHIVRGYGKVKASIPSKLVMDGSHLLTLTVLQTPNAPKRALLLKFPSREHRNAVLQGLRKLIGDVQNRQALEQLPVSPVQREVKNQGISLPGFSFESVVPYETVAAMILKERTENRNVLSLVLDQAADACMLEEEVYHLRVELERLQEVLQTRDSQLRDISVQYDKESKVRFQLGRSVQDLQMENADLRDKVQNADQAYQKILNAMTAQFDEELHYLQTQMDQKERVNRELLTNKAEIQRASADLKENIERLKHTIHEKEEEIRVLRAAHHDGGAHASADHNSHHLGTSAHSPTALSHSGRKSSKGGFFG